MTWPNCLPYSGQAILTSLYAHSLVLSCASGKSILELSHPWLGYAT